MERIERDQMFMEIAHVLAKRGNCGRGKVGALITRAHRIISTGYNGPLRGAADCSKEVCDLDSKCTRAIHAELNAILFAAREGISVWDSTIWCTHSPCENCAKYIIQAGIRRVKYDLKYDETGIAILNKAGIKVEQVNGK